MTDTIHTEQEREYLEVTLHFKGGTTAVACVKAISTQTDAYGRYTRMDWTPTEWDSLPRLESVALAKLQAVVTKKVRDIG